MQTEKYRLYYTYLSQWQTGSYQLLRLDCIQGGQCNTSFIICACNLHSTVSNVHKVTQPRSMKDRGKIEQKVRQKKNTILVKLTGDQSHV